MWPNAEFSGERSESAGTLGYVKRNEMKMMKLVILPIAVSYLTISFVLWQIDPSQWSIENRAVAIIGVIFVATITYLADPCDASPRITLEPEGGEDEQSANARLIALSPTMFDALRRWEWAESHGDRAEMENARKARNAALDQVKGEK